MKALKRIAPMAFSAALLLAGTPASAAIDSRYYVANASQQSQFDVYNDGRNTYVEAIPGLVVRGATADGQRFIVNGVPSQFAAQLNGSPIMIVRGMAPVPAAPKIAPVDSGALLSRIEEISSSIKRLEGVRSGTDLLAVNSVETTAAPTTPPEEEWVVPPDSSLRDLIAEFAGRAGWTVDINFNDVQTGEKKDIQLRGGQRIKGTFNTAMREMFSAIPESANVRAELRPDNEPPTIFIYRKGTQQ